MASSRIGIGILGTGGIASLHGDGVRAASDVLDLVAACDINAASLAEFGKSYGLAKLYTDYRAMLDDHAVEAVIVLAPHDLHVPLATAVLQAGKHLLLEKPIARTLEEADRIIACAQKANRTLLIGHQQRYFPEHQRIRQLIAQGDLGDVFLAQAAHHQDFRVPPQNWWRSREKAGGGCVLGAGIHKLDILRWFLGPVEEVFARHSFDPQRLEGEVAACVDLKFRSGALGSFVCNWAATGPMWETLALFGRRGRIVIPQADFDRAGTVFMAGPDGRENPLPVQPADYPSMWRHFADCIHTGQPPLTSGREARHALELVLAIHRSMDTGLPVKIPPAP